MSIRDLTSFTKVLPGSFSITSARATVTTDLVDDSNAQIYDDDGVDYHDGDFIHYVTLHTDTYVLGSQGTVWGLSNNIGNFFALGAASQPFLQVWVYKDASNVYIQLAEQDGANNYSTFWQASEETTYYLKIRRAEAVGTYGTFYVDIYPTAQDRLDNTNKLATRSITLHGSKKNYRYLTAVGAFGGSGIYDFEAGSYVEDIDTDIVSQDVTGDVDTNLPIIVKDAASIAEYIPKIISEAGSGATMEATLPSLDADATEKYIYLSVQLPSLSIEATVSAVGIADLTLPAITEDIRPGALPEWNIPSLAIESEGTVIPIVSVSGEIRPFTVEAFAGARVDDLVMESLTGEMEGTNGVIGSVEDFLPEITLATLAGATSITVLPDFTIEIDAIQGLIGRLEKYLPKYELEAQAIVEQIATADLNLSRMLVAATGTSYGFNAMSSNLRRLVLEVEGTVGVIGSVELAMPALEKGNMTGYDNPRGNADLTIRWV